MIGLKLAEKQQICEILNIMYKKLQKIGFWFWKKESSATDLLLVFTYLFDFFLCFLLLFCTFVTAYRAQIYGFV